MFLEHKLVTRSFSCNAMQSLSDFIVRLHFDVYFRNGFVAVTCSNILNFITNMHFPVRRQHVDASADASGMRRTHLSWPALVLRCFRIWKFVSFAMREVAVCLPIPVISSIDADDFYGCGDDDGATRMTDERQSYRRCLCHVDLWESKPLALVCSDRIRSVRQRCQRQQPLE